MSYMFPRSHHTPHYTSRYYDSDNNAPADMRQYTEWLERSPEREEKRQKKAAKLKRKEDFNIDAGISACCNIL